MLCLKGYLSGDSSVASLPQNDNPAPLHTRSERLLARKIEEERIWIVDVQGNVFTETDLKQGRVTPSKPEPHVAHAEPTTEPAQKAVHRTTQVDNVQEPPVPKDLIEYLEHAARHPFMPVVPRNEALSLSKYRSLNIRRQPEHASLNMSWPYSITFCELAEVPSIGV